MRHDVAIYYNYIFTYKYIKKTTKYFLTIRWGWWIIFGFLPLVHIPFFLSHSLFISKTVGKKKKYFNWVKLHQKKQILEIQSILVIFFKACFSYLLVAESLEDFSSDFLFNFEDELDRWLSLLDILIFEGEELPELLDIFFLFLIGLTGVGFEFDSFRSSIDVTDPMEIELDLVNRNYSDQKEI